MSKGSILMVLGAIVVIAPFSGLPLSWLEILFPIIGVALLVMGHYSRTACSSTPELATD